jgi:hypothetical protein
VDGCMWHPVSALILCSLFRNKMWPWAVLNRTENSKSIHSLNPLRVDKHTSHTRTDTPCTKSIKNVITLAVHYSTATWFIAPPRHPPLTSSFLCHATNPRRPTPPRWDSDSKLRMKLEQSSGTSPYQLVSPLSRLAWSLEATQCTGHARVRS